MTIRDYLKDYARKSDGMGALSYFATFSVYFAALGLGVLAWPVWWLVAPSIVILAFASVRLYVLQHDCGHYSLFATKALNDLAGHVLSVFSLTPYRVMQYNHNQHHAYRDARRFPLQRQNPRHYTVKHQRRAARAR